MENGQIQNTNTVRRKKARTTVPVTVGRRPYAKAAVFAFHYEKVDFEVIPQRDELLSVLRREYGFKTETYVIEDSDTSSQHQKLRKAMQTFLLEHKSDADEETLLIFYYGGHGLRGRDDKDDRIYFL